MSNTYYITATIVVIALCFVFLRLIKFLLIFLFGNTTEYIRHGHWIKESYEPYKCSICGRYEIEPEPYCPECGAKMNEEIK